MKIKEIKLFIKGSGLETLDRKTFVENLDLGIYDGRTIEILKTEC